MIKLGVNIDHIATIRQQRKEDFPNLVEAAKVCCNAGACGITIHLREDRRHIQDKDVFDIRQKVKTKLNLEMAASEDIIAVALKVLPDFVCLVPEKRQELTTEGGLDVKGQKDKIKSAVSRLKTAGIVVSMFIDPDIQQVAASKEVGADCIELHTGKYAKLFREYGPDSQEFKQEFENILTASDAAISNGLILNAGHGLDYDNISAIAKIKQMNEFNIGFAIIAKAVFVGLDKAVSDMKKLLG
jgi:pyridoxine 5-phosphate synthase